MAIRPIVLAPDPVLRVVADPVEEFDDKLNQLLDDMLETMYDAPGVGLAAVQVAVPLRVIVVDPNEKDEERNPIKLINPVIDWQSEETSVYEEGCLSLPKFYEDVERPSQVSVSYQDETGASQTIEKADFLIQIFETSKIIDI